MNTNKTFKRNFIRTSVLALTAMASLGAVGMANSHATPVYASDFTPISITNQNFNSSSNTDGFELVNKAHQTSTYGSSDDKFHGVINTTDTNYDVRQNASDKKVLKISAKPGFPAQYGYRMKDYVEFNANSIYMLSVDVYADGHSNTASLYLVDENNTVIASKEHIGSSNVWETQLFIIKTNEYAGLKVKLEMHLDGEGTVLFDSISCNQVSDGYYNTNLKPTHANDIIDKSDALDGTPITMESYPFVANTATKGTATYIYEKNTPVVNDGSNTKVAFKLTADNGYIRNETGDNFLTFKRNSITKVSVTLKTTNLSGTATLKLVETNVEKDKAKSSNDIKITSNTNSSLTNNYVDYNFYVMGSPEQDKTYKLVVGLGADEDTMSTGTMYITKVTKYKVTYSTYSNVSTGNDSVKLDLASAYEISDDGSSSSSDNYTLFSNARFDSIEIENLETPMPATPKNWTINKGNSSTQKCGVVVYNNENVLMLYNQEPDTLSVVSASKYVEANSYNRFALDINTLAGSAKVSLVATINDQEIVLQSVDVTTAGQWNTVVLLVKSAYQRLNVSFKIELNDQGRILVDNARFNYLIAPTDLTDDGNSAAYDHPTQIHTLDLSNPLTTNESTSKNIISSNLFTASDNSVEAGLINISNMDDNYLKNFYVDGANNVATFKNVTNKNIVIIRSSLQKVNFTYTLNLGYKLSANKNYSLSFKIYTQNLNCENDDLVGAIIKMTNFEEYASKIVTQDGETNGWTTYTLYLSPEEETTTSLQICLGSEDAKMSGTIFLADLAFDGPNDTQTITATNYTVFKTLTTKDEEEEEEKTDEETDEEDNNSSAWLYYIPTLAFALAIIITIVAVMMRKVNWKKPHKKSKIDYDRNHSLSTQLYTRKATVVREAKIAELNKQIAELNAERSSYEENYKKGLSQLRDMRIKRTPEIEIAKFEKDLKKNQKYSASIGVNLNKLHQELAYTQTQSYLNSLMKKLMNDDIRAQANNQTKINDDEDDDD